MSSFVTELYYGFLLWRLVREPEWIWVWTLSGAGLSISSQAERDFLAKYYVGSL